jgi:uncharacterized protein (TIGR03067 family)
VSADRNREIQFTLSRKKNQPVDNSAQKIIGNPGLCDRTDAADPSPFMKNTLTMLFCGAAILASACSTLQQSDSATLQGTWKGRETGGPAEGWCHLTITGDTLDFRGADPNEWYKGSFTLREDTNPKRLIGVVTECPAPDYIGKSVHAIYRIEAETLTLAGNEPGNPEIPTEFNAPGSRTFVLRKP